MEKKFDEKAKRLIGFGLDVGLPLLAVLGVAALLGAGLLGIFWLSKFF